MNRILGVLLLIPTTVIPSILVSSCGLSPYSPQAPPSSAKEIFSIGEWVGFVGHELTFHEDGYVIYRVGAPKEAISRLHPNELFSLREFLASEAFQEAREQLRSSGYQPGCCDGREVAFTFADESLGFPVCAGHVVEEPVETLIDLINDLGKRHFHRFRSRPLAKITCG